MTRLFTHKPTSAEHAASSSDNSPMMLMACKALLAERSGSTVAALAAVLSGLILSVVGPQRVIAQTINDGGIDDSNVTLNSDGSVDVDFNSFNVRTGPQQNTSNIPLPVGLPTEVIERRALPIDRSRLAPNTIEITPDLEFIDSSLEAALDRGSPNNTSYTLDAGSLELTTRFDLNRRVGSHDFGEGVEAIVTDGDGEVVSRESAFVQGDRIKIGPNGERLPFSDQVTVQYGLDDTVNLRVLNIRRDGANPTESGIYFQQDGQFIVEDLPNGGDLDFDDGEYLEIFGGRGEADVVEERVQVLQEEEIEQIPLDPTFVEEQGVEEDIIESVQQMDEVSEEVIERGEIEAPAARSPRLGHARRATAPTGERLIYSRYAAANQARAGSDGLGYTGQLRPLVNNPNVPPTLLSGNVTYNPFVGNNEAGVTATVGVTQFLNRTHRQARDEFGNAIVNPDGSNRRLLEPTGFFNNRRLVGYVPPSEPESIYGEPVSSVGGIFTLPSDQPIVVAAPDAQQVGRGDAAYTENVGGFLIEDANGGLSFVPQWTSAGYAQDPLTIPAGEASRLIYALVPQQAGQNLQLGQRYTVTEGADTYEITEGGFIVISADRQPENFVQESAEVYAVEDTLPNRTNAVTALFNGIQGRYSSDPNGERVPTVDVDNAAEADARVGNSLFPLESIITNPGQGAYSETTVAGGFYLGGMLTGGIGNQENIISRTETNMTVQTDELRIRDVINTFEVPQFQQEIVTTEITRTTEQAGRAFFNINEQGEIGNARFVDGEVIDRGEERRELSRELGDVVLGEERLVSQEVLSEEFILQDFEVIEADTTTSTDKESEANFAPVSGEITLGGILNFGNTPWTAAANTVRAELFARDTVIGRSSSGSEVGWRAEAIFHPFGEVQRDAYQYDQDGNVVPVYQTEAVVDGSGNRVTELLTSADGKQVEMPVSEFKLDDEGNLMIERVGTGVSRGPGVYVRVEDSFDDDDGVVVAGGIQLSF